MFYTIETLKFQWCKNIINKNSKHFGVNIIDIMYKFNEHNKDSVSILKENLESNNIYIRFKIYIYDDNDIS